MKARNPVTTPMAEPKGAVASPLRVAAETAAAPAVLE
jgi:hypothetical protein